MAFVTRRRRCGQMRGRSSEAGPVTFHVSRLTFHGSWERSEHDAAGRGSFAAVERSMSDRLLGITEVGRRHESNPQGSVVRSRQS